ncbi:subtilisin-like protein [Clathrospora elynae]|uniref:Subtilisin-like protein n=1 Tax=Clathrospora elynae TaxID=706981 RepID=A0A6A5SEC2_9PLEO|nr:subtilisin-like protein [Clathrospora elynae]
MNTHASLPYSIPDLDNDSFLPRQAFSTVNPPVNPPVNSLVNTNLVPSGAVLSLLGTASFETSVTGSHTWAGTAPVSLSSLTLNPTLISSSVSGWTSQFFAEQPHFGYYVCSFFWLHYGVFKWNTAHSRVVQCRFTEHNRFHSDIRQYGISWLDIGTATIASKQSSRYHSTILGTTVEIQQCDCSHTSHTNPEYVRKQQPKRHHSYSYCIKRITKHCHRPTTPQPDPSDSSTLSSQLFANRVIIGGRTLNIPTGLSGPQSVTNGDLYITAQPVPKPNDDENHGGGGLFAALGGIVSGSASAVGSIGSVSAGILVFSGGTTGAAAGLTAPLSGAIADVDKVVSSLNGIQDAFPVSAEHPLILDGGEGKLWRWDLIGQQMYITKLNDTQANDIPVLNDFTGHVITNSFDESVDGSLEEFRATVPVQPIGPVTQELHKPANFAKWSATASDNASQILERTLMAPDSSAPWWKKSLSAPPRDISGANSGPQYDPPYLADDTLGAGTTIYVLDGGFDVTIPDLQAVNRRVDTIITPNYLTSALSTPFDPNDGFRQNPEVIGGGDHGTMMAPIAGGKFHRVAPNADLCLVKTKNTYRGRTEGSNMEFTLPIYWQALFWFINEVETHIRNKLKQDSHAKSVINMSWDEQLPSFPVAPVVSQYLRYTGIQPARRNKGEMSAIEGRLREFIEFCKSNSIPLVVSADNQPTVQFVHDSIPQSLGTAEDSMVIVSAMAQDGIIWGNTVEEPNRRITVFAPGEEVVVPTTGNRIPTEKGLTEGKTHAAAVAVGLIAFYYGLPNWQRTQYVLTAPIKRVVQNHAWLRSNAEAPAKHGSPLAVYNLARGDPVHSIYACVQRRDKYGERQDQGLCSLSSNFATLIR